MVVCENPAPEGVAFIAHGLGGFKEQLHIIAFHEAFSEADYTTVRWDAANSIGESEGEIEAVTTTRYVEDMEDVISWAAGQEWYQEPFVLCGHSLGALASILYTEDHPEKVKALAPVSSAIAGELSAEVAWSKEELEDWQKSGVRIEKSISKPGVIKRIGWQFVENMLSYDVRLNAKALTMPVLMIVGDDDTGVPLRHQRLLLDKIPSKQKRLEVIEGASHNFRNPGELPQLRRLIKAWARGL